ncbi:MAG TPA: M56 family metallopeptidase [Candidatus Sulfotelmatobacter sp.]|nr:M56 family metallopeptidase [Candidatus Sulfotelmatobacter sp.]
MSALQHLAELVSAAALNSLLEGILIAGCAWALSLLGRRNSSTRFLLWFAALLAIGGVFLRGNTGVHNATMHAPEFAIPAHWGLYLFFVWAAAAGVGLARVGYGLVRVRWLRRNCAPLDKKSHPAIAGALSTNSARKISLAVSDHVRVPTAIGFFDPAILLPLWALTELSQEELHAVVLHELAHLRRWDDWTNLAQKIIRAVLFFHPAVWWIDSRLSIEREMSCDDLVLAEAASPRSYAECLVSVAEKGFVRRQLALAQAAVSHVKHTAARLARILDGRERQVTSMWKAASAALIGFAVLGVVTAQHTPRLVSFADESQPQSSAEASRISTPHAPVILASAKEEPIHQPVGPTLLSDRRRRVPKQRGNRSAALRLAQGDRNPLIAASKGPELGANPQGSPQIVSPNAIVDVNAKVAPEVFYFVLQTRQLDDAGSWRVTTLVWRVKVVAPVQRASGTVPRST